MRVGFTRIGDVDGGCLARGENSMRWGAFRDRLGSGSFWKDAVGGPAMDSAMVASRDGGGGGLRRWVMTVTCCGDGSGWGDWGNLRGRRRFLAGGAVV